MRNKWVKSISFIYFIFKKGIVHTLLFIKTFWFFSRLTKLIVSIEFFNIYNTLSKYKRNAITPKKWNFVIADRIEHRHLLEYLVLNLVKGILELNFASFYFIFNFKRRRFLFWRASSLYGDLLLIDLVWISILFKDEFSRWWTYFQFSCRIINWVFLIYYQFD